MSHTHAPSRDPRAARGALYGLLAAALFGLSAPVAKLLLSRVSPVLLAGLLYLGAAAGLWAHRALSPRSREASLTRADLPALSAIVALGGALAPVLMLLGLRRVSPLAGSLLLNLEAPFTVLLAVIVFREHLGRYGALSVALVLSGAAALRADGSGLAVDTRGALLLAAACMCWAIDNNLTQKLSLKDPFAIVRVKTLAAGSVNTLLGAALLARSGESAPPAAHMLAAMALGSASYGASVVLDAYALRLVGAAREAAYFATAPFVGALAGALLFRSAPRPWDWAAMAAMALGVAALLREKHSHAHVHEPVAHDHAHTHDAHHQHAHGPSDPAGEPHAHAHAHERIEHEHPHLPDAHHRHEH